MASSREFKYDPSKPLAAQAHDILVHFPEIKELLLLRHAILRETEKAALLKRRPTFFKEINDIEAQLLDLFFNKLILFTRIIASAPMLIKATRSGMDAIMKFEKLPLDKREQAIESLVNLNKLITKDHQEFVSLERSLQFDYQNNSHTFKTLDEELAFLRTIFTNIKRSIASLEESLPAELQNNVYLNYKKKLCTVVEETIGLAPKVISGKTLNDLYALVDKIKNVYKSEINAYFKTFQLLQTKHKLTSSTAPSDKSFESSPPTSKPISTPVYINGGNQLTHFNHPTVTGATGASLPNTAPSRISPPRG